MSLFILGKISQLTVASLCGEVPHSIMSQIPESLESEIFKRKPYLKNYFLPIHSPNELELLPSLQKVSNLPLGIELLDGMESLEFLDYVSYNSKPLASSYDPIKQAERALASQSLKKTDLVILLGLGNPILPLYANRQLKENPVVLAIDSMQEIVPLLWHPYLSEFLLTPGRHLFCGESFVQLLWSYLDGLPVERISGVRFIKNSSSIQLDSSFYSFIETRIRELFSAKMSDLLTKFEFETLWTSNILKNTIRYFSIENCFTISNLKNHLTGIPAMLVSAGPSLRKTIPLIKAIRNKVFLLSCDTSLKVLLKSGIQPDGIYTLDAQMNSIFHFLGEEITKIPVFADLVTSPYLLDTIQAKSVVYSMTAKFIMSASGDWHREVTAGGEFADEILGEIGDIQSGGSVATTAFDALRYMGCKDVFFVGQDLAYTGREIHSTGTHHNEKWLTLVSRKQSLEKINEAVVRKRDTRYVDSILNDKKVLTDYVLDLYRMWFEDSAKSIDSMRLVNIGYEGARITGMENISPEGSLTYFNKYKNHEYPWKNHPIWQNESSNFQNSELSNSNKNFSNKKNSDNIKKINPKFQLWNDITDSITWIQSLENQEDVVSKIENWFSHKSYLKKIYRKSEIYIARHRDSLEESKKESILIEVIYKELKRLKRKIYPMMDEDFFPGNN
jgi:hypothetical protein